MEPDGREGWDGRPTNLPEEPSNHEPESKLETILISAAAGGMFLTILGSVAYLAGSCINSISKMDYSRLTQEPGAGSYITGGLAIAGSAAVFGYYAYKDYKEKKNKEKDKK